MSANQLDLGPEERPPLILNSSKRFFFSKSTLFHHENGFRIQTGQQASAVLFSDARILKWKEDDALTNGICTGTRYEILLSSHSQKISLKHISKIDPPDDFPFFAEKLLQRLADGAQAQMESGGLLQGEGWTLAPEGLEAEGRKLEWSEVSDVDLIENEITVWKLQESYPFFRIQAETAQSRILLKLLERHVKKNPSAGPSGALGRFLFRRKAASAIQLFLALFSQRKTYDFYENGLIQRPGHRVLFFNNCETLQYQATLQFINGVYSFTRTVLKLKSVPDRKSVEIKTQRYGSDKGLEQVKLNLSKRIADRLYLKVATQGDVAWGRLARISRDEIRYISTSMLGGNLSFTFPLSQPISYSMDAGKFYLFRVGEAQPFLTMDCDEENFYPGFFLLLRLVAEH